MSTASAYAWLNSSFLKQPHPGPVRIFCGSVLFKVLWKLNVVSGVRRFLIVWRIQSASFQFEFNLTTTEKSGNTDSVALVFPRYILDEPSFGQRISLDVFVWIDCYLYTTCLCLIVISGNFGRVPVVFPSNDSFVKAYSRLDRNEVVMPILFFQTINWCFSYHVVHVFHVFGFLKRQPMCFHLKFTIENAWLYVQWVCAILKSLTTAKCAIWM